jgi:hypothetical protein
VAPRALDVVGMCAGAQVNEAGRMVDSLVRVIVCLDFGLRSPAVIDDVCSGFAPGSKNIHQGVSG